MEEGRAQHALQAVQDVEDEEFAGNYQTYAKDLPMLIKTNGLGAALAFVQAKASDNGGRAEAYEQLYEDVSNWLSTEDRKYLLDPARADGDDLVQQVVSLDSSPYRAVTREVLAYLSWLRRFAEGRIDTNDDTKE